MKQLLFIIVCWPFLSIAQVEHNFEMPPSKTDCHELPKQFNSSAEAIKAVEASTFRLQQSIKISRYHTPRSARFYSCDGNTGYLIADETDEKQIIYIDVPEKVWNQFINSVNPIDFYETEIRQKYKLPE